jgi:1-acyl-sn-glycerol-3-phosphate acyltransferase
MADHIHLGLQYLLGRLAAVITVPLIFLAIRLMGYRIRDLDRIREQVDRLYQEHEGPWIVCPNHLTMIDSPLLSYGMASLPDHILKFNRVPWNLPERDNFQTNALVASLCYLAKCLPVNRGGDRGDLQRVLEQCCCLLEAKQSLMIFPEGGRSRVGHVDRENFSYGVGRFIDECPSARVMLIYLRGDHQEGYGAMPCFGERFTMIVEAFDPVRTDEGGRRDQREYARQIVARLADIEERHFASRR